MPAVAGVPAHDGRSGSLAAFFALALLAGAVHGLALLPRPSSPGGLGAATTGILAGTGLLLAGVVLRRSPRPIDAARGGFLFGGCSSALALHWIPAAAEPWFGPAGIVAGLTVWSVHAGAAAMAFGAASRLRGSLPFPLLCAAAWMTLEWLPGALPILHLPRPELAAALVDLPPILLPFSLFGGIVVVAFWAGIAGGITEWTDRRIEGGRMRASGTMGAEAVHAPGGSGQGPGEPGPSGPMPRVPGSRASVLSTLVLVGLLLGGGGVTAVRDALPPDGVPGFSLVAAELPLARVILTDPARRAASIREGVAVGPADLWPEAVLPAADSLPPGPGGMDALAGTHLVEGGRRYNALARIMPGGRIESVHRKRWLVPGVERTRLIAAGAEGRGWARGDRPRSFLWGEYRVGGLICFEVLFPTAVAALRRDGAILLLHVGNDAMLQAGGPFPVVARTPGRQQEAVLRLRAREFRIPVVRSSMGGWVGGWDPQAGRLDAAPLEPGRFRFTIPEAGPVPPASYLAPVLPPAAAVLLMLGGVGLRRRQNRGRNGQRDPGFLLP